MKLNFCMLLTLRPVLLSSVDALLAAGGRSPENPDPDPGLAGSTGSINFLFLCSISPNRC